MAAVAFFIAGVSAAVGRDMVEGVAPPFNIYSEADALLGAGRAQDFAFPTPAVGYTAGGRVMLKTKTGALVAIDEYLLDVRRGRAVDDRLIGDCVARHAAMGGGRKCPK